MRLLDLFCGAGGAAMGYYRAGFTDIVGVDIKPQPRYPFAFVQGDALEYVAKHGAEFDMIHASPPCQAYTTLGALWDNEYPDLVEATRDALGATGRPYVIENVPGAPLIRPVMLCGMMFSLQVFRHRLFETHPWILSPPHPSHGNHTTGTHRYPHNGDFFTVTGNGGGKGGLKQWQAAMGIDWMTKRELTQAIPPAYTEYIGRRMLDALPMTNSQTIIHSDDGRRATNR